MLEIVPPTSSNTAIVTLAIGSEYEKSWQRHALPGWLEYCKKNGIGLYVQTGNLDTSENPKKKQWQKLLLGSEIEKLNKKIRTVCYLDTDILINSHAPNIFDYHKKGTIGLVSKFNKLPYDRLICLRRIAFLRKKFIDSNYPLDSALFMNIAQLYDYQNLTPQSDYACTGLIVFDIGTPSNFLREIFYKYQAPVYSITDGGEEVHTNYELLSNFEINWLDYKFQTFWTYEIAWKYPFLYENKYKNMISECINASLWGTHFLHFAGSWNEGNHWKFSTSKNRYKWQVLLQQFEQYLQMEVTGRAVGKIIPKKSNNLKIFFKNLLKKIDL